MGRRRRDRYQPPEVATPFSLSEDARGLDAVGAGLLPVRAWVQDRSGLFRLDAVAVSQTRDAVLVRWQGAAGPLEAWVWRAAVKHRRATR